jgi:altronate hydrolase
MKRNAIVIDHADNVATLLVDLAEQEPVVTGEGAALTVQQPIPAGHKVALVDLAEGEIIRKYGHPIGVAGQAISAGEHVHTHNLAGLED